MRVFVVLRLSSTEDPEAWWVPVGVYNTREEAAKAYRDAGPHKDDVEMYTVEFEVGAPIDVGAWDHRGMAI